MRSVVGLWQVVAMVLAMGALCRTYAGAGPARFYWKSLSTERGAADREFHQR